jgi:hypothetical protein
LYKYARYDKNTPLTELASLFSDFPFDTTVTSEFEGTVSGPTRQLKKWAIAPPTS